MKKKIFPLLLLCFTWHVVGASPVDKPVSIVIDTQEDQSDAYIPLVQNYPSFMVEILKMDYLYNLDLAKSVKFHRMKKMDWRALFGGNVAILYAIRINHSRFAFCPGIGWSTLYYAFTGQNNGAEVIYPTLKRDSEVRTECQDLDNKPGKTVLRSVVKIPFIDLLLRLRFNTVLEEPKAGFHGWLGVRLGLRQRASAIVDYREYDSVASSIYNSDFNLKPYTVGFQIGMGYSRFGITAGFNCTPLFKDKQGPAYANLLRSYSFGVYVDLV